MSKQIFDTSSVSFSSDIFQNGDSSFASTVRINDKEEGFPGGSGYQPPFPPEPEDPGGTLPVGGNEKGRCRVVGWLVCVSGNPEGKSYELHTNWNTVGRSSVNDVCIDDDSVSRETMFSIGYDDRSSQFYLRRDAGGRDHFIHYNGKETKNRLLHPQDMIQINAYDSIDIGDTVTLVFVPFCGESFQWQKAEDVSYIY